LKLTEGAALAATADIKIDSKADSVQKGNARVGHEFRGATKPIAAVHCLSKFTRSC
jgi:hypothetical protein